MVSIYVYSYILLTFISSCNRRLMCQGVNPVKLLAVLLDFTDSRSDPCVKLQVLQ
jgi:hypothetical protein